MISKKGGARFARRASRVARAGEERGLSCCVVVLGALCGEREAPQLGSLAGGCGGNLPPLRGAPLRRFGWLLGGGGWLLVTARSLACTALS